MNKLPEADHAARMELYRQGLTDKQIGSRLFLAQSTVFQWRHSNGLPSNHKKTDLRLDYTRMRQLLESGLRPIQVAREMGCSQYPVYQFAKNCSVTVPAVKPVPYAKAGDGAPARDIPAPAARSGTHYPIDRLLSVTPRKDGAAGRPEFGYQNRAQQMLALEDREPGWEYGRGATARFRG